MRTRVWVAAALCGIVAVIALAAVAGAHAYVVATSPGVNATTVAPPDRVTVSFDEPIGLESREPLTVRDRAGKLVPCIKPAFVNPDDATQIVCTLAAPLPVGAYTVAWRVTSADTHVVHGVFSFGVGMAVNAAAGETHGMYDPSGPLATTLRWLVLLAAIALSGVVGFEAFVLRAGFGCGSEPAIAVLRGRCASFVNAGIIVGIAASVGALDVQAAAATGTDAVRSLAHVDEILSASVWGWMWLVRIAALATLAALTRMRARGLAGVACGVAGILLATQSLSGHALVSQSAGSVLPVVADWLHLTAAALWSAGLALIAVAMRPALASLAEDARDAFATVAVARFSAVAIASVAAIVATGVYGAVVHVPTPTMLVTTLYGGIIVLKALLLVPLLVLGYGNYRRSRTGAARARLVPTVIREAVLVFAILGLSAILTGLSLPHPT
jgi:copper transport protein